MTSRDRDRFRKYESGSNKRARKQQKDEFIKKQTGSFNKYLNPTTSKENYVTDVPKSNCEYVNITYDSSTNISEQKSPLISETDHVLQDNVSTSLENEDSVETLLTISNESDVPKSHTKYVNITSDSSTNISEQKSPFISETDHVLQDNVFTSFENQDSVENLLTTCNNNQSTAAKNVSNSTFESLVVMTDLTDPGNWPIPLSHAVRIDIIKNGPYKVQNLNYPLDSEKRKFSDYYYTRSLSNGEVINRYWLIYSKKNNCVYCFYCKLFPINANGLSTTGINDWWHLSRILNKHENSPNHLQSLKAWHELKIRVSTCHAIDNYHMKIMEKEKAHWHNVLLRIFAAIQYLAKNNDAFRGSSDVLYEKNNGKFLGIIEMLAKFDPDMYVVLKTTRRISIILDILFKTH